MKTEKDLLRSAYDVADRYRDGFWPEWGDKGWKDAWKFLIDELRRRCPGFTDQQYGQALNQGFSDSR
jgi:hypothetical protein